MNKNKKFSKPLTTSYKLQVARGFTLIELLIVISIVTILAGGIGLNILGYQRAQALDLATQQLAATIRDANNRSVTQQSGLQWGMYFKNNDTSTTTPDFYAIFAGSSYAGSATTTLTYFDYPIEFSVPSSGGSDEIVFTQLSGRITASTTIAITNGSDTKTILVDVSGAVIYGEREVDLTVPGAPTIGTATPGNTQATVAFSAPASNGGSAITSYTASSTPGGFSASGSASPLIVTGLTNGTAYTFTVTATNAIGTGPASSASNSVTPATVPSAPIIGTATAGVAEATVSFDTPVSNGGSAITSYTATSNPGGITASAAASPITVTGLTNGTAYTFTVTATNSAGTGPASSASNSVTPATVPDAPTIGTATAGNGQASVAFSAPVSDGGSAITSYTASSTPGGFSASGAASPLVVTGLTNGTAYTFKVSATNAVGTSTASAASNSVTPATVPGAPTIGTATSSNQQATVNFTAPASNGGSAILDYTASSTPGNITRTGPCCSLNLTGLTNDIAYTFMVWARNAVGTSTASAASNSVTPAATEPSQVTGLFGIAFGGGIFDFEWSVPANNGSAITLYNIYRSVNTPGAAGLYATSTTATFTDELVTGSEYYYKVSAVNGVGEGPKSTEIQCNALDAVCPN